jgi:hypothetical protein
MHRRPYRRAQRVLKAAQRGSKSARLLRIRTITHVAVRAVYCRNLRLRRPRLVQFKFPSDKNSPLPPLPSDPSELHLDPSRNCRNGCGGGDGARSGVVERVGERVGA